MVRFWVAVAALVLSAWALPANAAPAADPLTADEAGVLMKIVRSAATPAVSAPTDIPPRLRETLNLPLIVTLYSDGTTLQQSAAKPTLAESAATAAAGLARELSLIANGPRLLQEGRLALDVVVEQQPLPEAYLSRFVQGVEPGVQGLAFPTKGGTVYSTPLGLLLQWRSYVVRNWMAPPGTQRIATTAFVEERTDGPVLPTLRGNVLRSLPHAEEVVEATMRAGLWLLRTQREDGSFLLKYLPDEDRTDPQPYLLTDHLRAAMALATLQYLTGDERFAQASTRALQYVVNPKFVRQELRDGLLYVPMDKDEISASALLLTALCYRAMTEAQPTADARMNQIGEYLCVMTAPDGRLYSKLLNARKNAPPFIIRGQAYGDTLLALCLLQRISPTDRRRQVIDRMANLLISPGSSDLQIALVTDPGTDREQIASERRAVGRVIEALTEYYRLSRSEKHAQAAFRLTDLLLKSQVAADRAARPDCIGGFGEPDMPPDTLTTASTVCGLASAYELSLLLRKSTDRFAAPARQAAQFLLTMQYRSVNAYFLRNRELALGAFRGSPQELTIETLTVAESVRALVAATTITAETVAPAR